MTVIMWAMHPKVKLWVGRIFYAVVLYVIFAVVYTIAQDFFTSGCTIAPLGCP